MESVESGNKRSISDQWIDPLNKSENNSRFLKDAPSPAASSSNYSNSHHHHHDDDMHNNSNVVINELVLATRGTTGTLDSLNLSMSERHTFCIDTDEEDGMDKSNAGKFVPDMWSKDFIGLYAQYAAVGLLYGTSGVLYPFCNYVYKGDPNVCGNASSITFFAWNFKLIFAVITDIYRPFNLRRRPWMLFGWAGVLVILLILACTAHLMSASTWLSSLLLMQGFLMFSDVPADGYSVELGKLESLERRGQILATGQRIRFSFSVVAGVIQTFLTNGPSTNAADCEISFLHCWGWGLNVNGYYALLFVLIGILATPIIWLKETDPSNIPKHTFKEFASNLWSTLENLTTFYLLVFVIGTGVFTNFISMVNLFMQYDIIELTEFESGIDTITSYGALVIAIIIFQKYLINRNWRWTNYGSTIIASTVGLLWIPAYFNAGGTRNAWYTIFIDLDQAFVQGLSQVLYSLSVIELSRPGQEATTYELIITVGNAAGTLSQILSTQMLTPLRTVGCTEDDATCDQCPSSSVCLAGYGKDGNNDGPYRFTTYCLTLITISVVCCCIFTPFLPKDKAQCHEWRRIGMQQGSNARRGYICAFVACSIIVYGFVVAILLLDSSTSCLPAVGGSGC